MPGKIKLVLPSEFHTQVNYLHQIIGNIEWSGALLYDPKGDIQDYKNMELRVKGVYPLAKGTSGYVEHTFGDEIVDIYKAAGDSKLGWIHSHHSMGAFYSGVDMDDLHTNTDNYNYYLTIIVNLACKPVAKVSWIQEEEIEYSVKDRRIRNNSGGWFSFKKNNKKGKNKEEDKPTTYIKKTLCIADCEIVNEFEGWFITALDKFEKRIAPKPVVHYGHQHDMNSMWDKDEELEEQALEILECLIRKDYAFRCVKQTFAYAMLNRTKFSEMSVEEQDEIVEYIRKHYVEYAVYNFGYSTAKELRDVYDTTVKLLKRIDHLPAAKRILASLEKLDVSKVDMDNVGTEEEKDEKVVTPGEQMEQVYTEDFLGTD